MERPQRPEEKQATADINSIRVLAEAIEKAINDQNGDKRFIDLTRIPLICLSITGIHSSLEEIKGMIKDIKQDFVTHEAFDPVKNLVYGLVGLMLTSVIVAILAMVIR